MGGRFAKFFTVNNVVSVSQPLYYFNNHSYLKQRAIKPPLSMEFSERCVLLSALQNLHFAGPFSCT